MPLDKQELFNKVYDHLMKQQCAATDDIGDCMYYESETGNRCAVGCLIKKEFYDHKMEGKKLADKLVLKVLSQSLGEIPSDDILDMLNSLQHLHDTVLTRANGVKEEMFGQIRMLHNVK